MADLDWDVSIDYYAVLGVTQTASEEEIRDAYRRLAKQLHPDANPDESNATKEFQQIEKAYAVLKDSLVRRDYDDARADFFGVEPEPTPTEQYFNCPHCHIPNVMPPMGLTVQSLCGNCRQPLLGMAAQSFEEPILSADYSSPAFTSSNTGYQSPQRSRLGKRRSSNPWPFIAGCGLLLALLLVVCSGGLPTDTSNESDVIANDADTLHPLETRGNDPSPLAVADVTGAWLSEWDIEDSNGGEGSLGWHLLLRDDGGFILDIYGGTTTGAEARVPRQSGTWHLRDNRIIFSKPIPIPVANQSIEQVEHIDLQRQFGAGFWMTYGQPQVTVMLNRSQRHPALPLTPSPEDMAKAGLGNDGSMTWSYVIDFIFQVDHRDKLRFPIDITTERAPQATGSQVELVEHGAQGKAIRVNGGGIFIDTGEVANREEWTLSFCFKPESLAVESDLYSEMDSAGSDLYGLILSREGHVYLASWNAKHKPEPWMKTRLTTKACEVGKWSGLILHRREGKVFGHVNDDHVSVDMQVSGRATRRTAIARKFHGVIDEIYVAGHRMNWRAYDGLVVGRVTSEQP